MDDEAKPHGMFRPGAEGKANLYLVGSRIPKVRDWKPPRALHGEGSNEYHEESDQAYPQGIPRPKLED